MEIGLRGKKALVTGATHGIGREISLLLAQEGVDVAFLSRNEENLKAQEKLLLDYPINTLSLKCDVLIPSEINIAWQNVVKCWGGIDILINNVGGGGRWGSEDPINTSISVWNEVLQKNLGATTQFTMLAIPAMLKNKWGRVITITSTHGTYIAGRPWFNVAKVAQSTLMKNLSRQQNFSRNGITFNCVAPGAIMIPETGWDNFKKNSPVEFEEFITKLPLGRLGTPREVAEVVLFLCSNQACLVNGASIIVDGGESNKFE